MPYNTLLLPLVGGYWFIHIAYYTRYRAYTLSSYRLLLESATCGVGLLFLAQVLVVLVPKLAVLCPLLLVATKLWFWIWELFMPPNTGAPALALALGPTFGFVANQIWDRDYSTVKTIARYGSDLLQLFEQASKERRLVMVTLNSRKVYIGTVVLSPNLRVDNPFIVLLPSQSGFRTSEEQRLRMTTDYLAVYEGMERGEPAFEGLSSRDFLVVLPIANIVSATPFSELVDADFRLAGDKETSDDEIPVS